jgi:hypothetical protein
LLTLAARSFKSFLFVALTLFCMETMMDRIENAAIGPSSLRI